MILVAATLCVLLALAHSLLGERYILRRMHRPDVIPKLFGSDVFTKRTLRFAWHLTTVAWIGIAGALVALAGGSTRDAMLVLAATNLTSAVVAVVGSRGRHPAWVVLLAIGVLAWLGAPPAP